MGNTPEGKGGRTLLHESADTGNKALAEFLLAQRNIRVDACTYGGYTPLRLARSRGCAEVVQLLLAHGADQSQLDDYDSFSESDDDSMDGTNLDDLCIAGRPV